MLGDDFCVYSESVSIVINIMYKNLKTSIFTVLLFFIGFCGTVFAEPPTATDLNLRYDASNGTTRNGYIDSFKSSFGSYFF